jgi:hypothetical protein
MEYTAAAAGNSTAATPALGADLKTALAKMADAQTKMDALMAENNDLRKKVAYLENGPGINNEFLAPPTHNAGCGGGKKTSATAGALSGTGYLVAGTPSLTTDRDP